MSSTHNGGNLTCTDPDHSGCPDCTEKRPVTIKRFDFWIGYTTVPQGCVGTLYRLMQQETEGGEFVAHADYARLELRDGEAEKLLFRCTELLRDHDNQLWRKVLEHFQRWPST